MTVKAGVKQDGTLTALEFTVLGTGGAYPAGGTSLVDWLARDLYTCPNVRTSSTDVFINAGPARAFRAPGHPQGAWALEQMMDALARGDRHGPGGAPVEEHPLLQPGPRGQPAVHDAPAFRECLEEGAAAFGWERGAPGRPRAKRAGAHPARRRRRRRACGLPAAAGRLRR